MYRCIGCNANISWDGRGMFSYTCPCGATVLQDDETGQLSMPSSVNKSINEGRALPHLDDLIGTSDYSSPEKTQIIADMRNLGFIWMRECEQCKADGTLERYESRTRREKLKEEARQRAEEENWDIERLIQEMVKIDKGE